MTTPALWAPLINPLRNLDKPNSYETHAAQFFKMPQTPGEKNGKAPILRVRGLCPGMFTLMFPSCFLAACQRESV
jgi:hypothetical protein